MINIERTNYTYASVDTTPETWEGLKAIAQHAVDTYDQTELDVVLPGPAENRQESLSYLSQIMQAEDELPSSMSKEQLHVLLVAADELRNMDIPGLSAEEHTAITDQLDGYSIQRLFDDNLTDEAKLAL